MGVGRFRIEKIIQDGTGIVDDDYTDFADVEAPSMILPTPFIVVEASLVRDDRPDKNMMKDILDEMESSIGVALERTTSLIRQTEGYLQEKDVNDLALTFEGKL